MPGTYKGLPEEDGIEPDPLTLSLILSELFLQFSRKRRMELNMI